jgi:hypothetical protein
MNEPRARRQLSLGRLLLWVAICAVWLGVFFNEALDLIGDSRWFGALLFVVYVPLLSIELLVASRWPRVAEKLHVEWTLLLCGVAFMLSAFLYRLLFND